MATAMDQANHNGSHAEDGMYEGTEMDALRCMKTLARLKATR